MSGRHELLVWVFQTGEPLPIDPGDARPMRAMNLTSALLGAGHRVVLWSAAFDHQRKRHRPPGADRTASSARLQIRLLASPGYRRNVGAGRLADHACLARSLKRALRRCAQGPDVAFVGYPPIEAAAVMTRWLAERNVPALLDVKDQWPTVLESAVPAALRPLARCALWPYARLARRAMRDATGLGAMADGFLDWARGFAGRDGRPADGVFPLTSPLHDIPAPRLAAAREAWDRRGIRADGTARFLFAGTLSQAFDFEPVREAAERARAASSGCEFVLCGDGAGDFELRRRMRGLGNVHLPGRIDRPGLVALAERCCAALAPYRNTPDFRLSLPNKVLDALGLGLPVLSPLDGEVAALIAEHGVGLSYGPGFGRSLHDCIEALAKRPEWRAALAARARAVHAQHFAFDRVYGGLVRHLEQLARHAAPRDGAP